MEKICEICENYEPGLGCMVIHPEPICEAGQCDSFEGELPDLSDNEN